MRTFVLFLIFIAVADLGDKAKDMTKAIEAGHSCAPVVKP
jgi:hypothetical protein